MFYAHIKNNEILDATEAKYLDADILNIAISEEIAQNIQDYKFEAPDKIIPKTKAELKMEAIKTQKQQRIAEIKIKLVELDNKTIRPLRAGEADILAELEQEAQGLRDELKELEKGG